MMRINEFVKDSLSSMTNEELIKKYSLKNNKEISLILSSEKAQIEIKKQRKPLTKKEKDNLNKFSNTLNECLGVLK